MAMKYVSRISIRPRAQIACGMDGAECCCLISTAQPVCLSVGLSMFSVTTATTEIIFQGMANNTTAQHVDNYRMNNRSTKEEGFQWSTERTVDGQIDGLYEEVEDGG